MGRAKVIYRHGGILSLIPQDFHLFYSLCKVWMLKVIEWRKTATETALKYHTLEIPSDNAYWDSQTTMDIIKFLVYWLPIKHKTSSAASSPEVFVQQPNQMLALQHEITAKTQFQNV
jgi:hypothetical protein